MIETRIKLCDYRQRKEEYQGDGEVTNESKFDLLHSGLVEGDVLRVPLKRLRVQTRCTFDKMKTIALKVTMSEVGKQDEKRD